MGVGVEIRRISDLVRINATEAEAEASLFFF